MIVKLVGCDNPACTETGEPEVETKRSHKPPRGWLTTKVTEQGSTVVLTVETCSIECISPAVKAVDRAEESAEGFRMP